ncbi:hypothetical protein AHF37_06804 [Paragonimus kellicotti]|nr:hypothetical protein AHF37_06804 [Paragonimus kellicotti]
MFGIGSLVEAVILLLNAVCILHEKRFLAKIGWATDDKDFSEPSSVKSQLLNVIHSLRTVMRTSTEFLPRSNVPACFLKPAIHIS